ncbi:MAG: tetratricopeptide repeat protein [Methylophagaceae bacterium]
MLFTWSNVFSQPPSFDEIADKDTAFNECETKAKQDNLRHWPTIVKDYCSDAYELKKLAEQGDAEAQLELSDRYYRGGKGVAGDFKKWKYWLIKAAESGDVNAQSKLAGALYRAGDYKQTFEWYQKLALQDELYGIIRLAEMYQNGEGVVQDNEQALEWLKTAIGKSNSISNVFFPPSRAEYDLGKAYYEGVITSQDYKQALHWYQKSAEQLNYRALFALGKMYQQGQGVSQDYLKSYINLQTSILMEMKYHHQGGAPDKEMSKIREQVARKLTIEQINKAKVDVFNHLIRESKRNYYPIDTLDSWLYAEWRRNEWDQKILVTHGHLIRQGHGQSQRLLAKIFQQHNSFFGENNQKNLEIFKRYGYQKSYLLNKCYLSFYGLSVEQDYNEAIKWCSLASQSEVNKKKNGFDVVAMYLVAWMHDTIEDIPQNYKQAFSWYQKAADLGYGDAQLRLAEMYQQGQGVEKNNVLALQWYQTAAKQGYNKAQRVLADLYQHGTLVEQDKHQAFKWYKKAAVLEDLDAQYALAQIYVTGEVVEKDTIKSYVFTSYLADEYDNSDATKLSEQLTQKMTEVELEQAQTLGKQWLHDAKYRTLGVAVEPPFEW